MIPVQAYSIGANTFAVIVGTLLATLHALCQNSPVHNLARALQGVAVGLSLSRVTMRHDEGPRPLTMTADDASR